MFPKSSTTEHPRLCGSALEMLAAQSKKLASKSPPTLADAAADKYFRPWKKEAPPSLGQGPAASVNNLQLPSHLVIPYHGPGDSALAGLTAQCKKLAIKSSPSLADPAADNAFGPWKKDSPDQRQPAVRVQRPVTSSACGASGSYGGENISYAAPPPPQGDTQGSLIGKVDTISRLGADHSQVATQPFESFPFNTNARVTATEDASSSAPPRFHVGGPREDSPWLFVAGTAPTLNDSTPDNSHPQHVKLQDTYNLILPGQSGRAPFAALAGPPAPQLRRRAYGAKTCVCTNCAKVRRLCPPGVKLPQNTLHNCPIPDCGKVFHTPCFLKIHLRCHSDERPFVCTWQSCGKRFKFSYTMRSHRRTHAGEKRFECHICSKRIVRSGCFRKHMETCKGNKEGKKNGSGSCSNSENRQLSQPPLVTISPLGRKENLEQQQHHP